MDDFDDVFDELFCQTLRGAVEVLVLVALLFGLFVWRFL